MAGAEATEPSGGPRAKTAAPRFLRRRADFMLARLLASRFDECGEVFDGDL